QFSRSMWLRVQRSCDCTELRAFPTRRSSDLPDGTCIRDYIHVLDLAEAHLLALDHLARGGPSRIYNLGNGAGFSVREVYEAAVRVTGRPIPLEVGPRRPGDPPVLVASAERARRELGWVPRRPSVEAMIESAW